MPTTEIAVLSLHRHPRLRYVLGECGRMLGCRFRLILDVAKYRDVTVAARINYGAPPSGTPELLLASSSFLAGKDKAVATGEAPFFRWLEEDFWQRSSTARPWLAPQYPYPDGHGGRSGGHCVYIRTPWLSQEQGSPLLAMLAEADPFAAIFFCLSRWEEYQPGPRDQYGRFAAQQSHAAQHGYLERPIVHEILALLQQALQSLFPDFKPPKPTKTQLLPTYDIDLPFAYLHRGWRGLAAGVADIFRGQSKRSLARLRCLWAQQDDPYDTFHWIRALHERLGLPARFFCLLSGNQTRLDPNPSPQHPAYRSLIQSLSRWAAMGIHPSYYSSEQPALIAREKASLVEILGQPVTHSRQHFLRFSLPTTYQQLLLAGITQDYSMGYADAIGWRAGSHQAFRWYDLEAEEVSGLWVHPFAAMEVTLLKYQNLAPARSARIGATAMECVCTRSARRNARRYARMGMGIGARASKCVCVSGDKTSSLHATNDEPSSSALPATVGKARHDGDTPAWAIAEQRITALYEGVKPYGGSFILLWHNSSFAKDYGWAAWQTMYERLLESLVNSRSTPQKDP